ncbi:MAG: NAD(P)H-dependent oxidoreductase [Pseudomonadota bacterium]|nr:NAD(P)H-dependent oxidoreductase [Pseudomonadota bacterium]
MRALVIFAHPELKSLNGQIYNDVLNLLQENGHQTEAIDLYRDNFNPVLAPEERAAYFDETAANAEVQRYAESLAKADVLIFCFPTWCLGPPAILKGFFDRVMKPGVSFKLAEDGTLHPNLQHIQRVISIVTYGRGRSILHWFGDPPRKMMTRYIRWFISRSARISYCGLYNLHKPDAGKIGRFRDRVMRLVAQL